MRFLKELRKLFKGAVFTLVVPTLILGLGTYGVVRLFGCNSVQLYIWVALVWWLSINYIK